MQLSACIEWIFADEAEDFADRIRQADKHGVEAVEFWRWTNKDLDAVAAALAETGVKLTSFVAEPMIPLTDRNNREPFLKGLAESIVTAKRLGAHTLIAQAGNDLAGIERRAQRDALIETLTRAGELLAGTGLRLGLEPLNTRIDHVGYFLPSTRGALDIVNATERPEIGIVYDIYHSAVMDEETADVIGHDIGKIFHVHIADHPGRNEPGSGTIDLANRLNWLVANGYSGALGLEYRPLKRSSDTLEAVRSLVAG